MEIVIPNFLSHLKVDERGYPIPWFVAYVDGKPDFRVIDPVKMKYSVEQDKCFICGKKHRQGSYFFITGPEGLKNGVHSDCPMHKECAEFSLQVCPHMVYEKASRNERGSHYQQAKSAHPGISNGKPERLYLIEARKWKLIQVPSGDGRGTYPLIKFTPVKFEEYRYEAGRLTHMQPTTFQLLYNEGAVITMALESFIVENNAVITDPQYNFTDEALNAVKDMLKNAKSALEKIKTGFGITGHLPSYQQGDEKEFLK